MAKRRLKSIALHSYLIIVSCLTLSPIFLLALNAFKPKLGFMSSAFTLPERLTLQSIAEAWVSADYSRGFMNSIIVGVSTIIIVVVCASLTAYALTQLEFKGKNTFIALLLVVISVPMGVYLVPIFFLFTNLHLMNTLTGIIIVYSGIYMAFSIFLFRTYFLGVPKEICESAFLDGLNHFQVYSKVVMPISKPVVITVSIILMLWTWNEFFFANALLQTMDVKTVATRYLAFRESFSADWNLISSAGVITILPMLIIYVFLQDKFVSGIVEGSLKG